MQGTPTCWFDAQISCVGAYTNDSQMVTWYTTQYTTRRNTATDVSVTVDKQLVSGQTYNVIATVGLDTGGTAKTVRVYIIQAIDHYGGETYSRNCFIQAAPTTDIALTPGQSQQVTATFTFDSNSWANKQNIRLIAWAELPGSPAPKQIYNAGVAPAFQVEMTGTVDLQNFANPAGQTANMELRSPGTTNVLYSYPITLDASGNFTIEGIATGNFDVALKFSHWLRTVIHGKRIGGGTNTISLTQIDGDASGDNAVNLLDLSSVLAMFNMADAACDLDGSGAVGIGDLSVILSNYGQTGDN